MSYDGKVVSDPYQVIIKYVEDSDVALKSVVFDGVTAEKADFKSNTYLVSCLLYTSAKVLLPKELLEEEANGSTTTKLYVKRADGIVIDNSSMNIPTLIIKYASNNVGLYKVDSTPTTAVSYTHLDVYKRQY